MHKKAQGLSMHTIVIAVIVLIVLFVLITVFTGYFGNFISGFTQTSTRSCEDGFEQRESRCLDGEKRVFGNFQPPLQPDSVCCKLPGTDSVDSGNLLGNLIPADCPIGDGGFCSSSCAGNSEEFPRGKKFCDDRLPSSVCCITVEQESEPSSKSK
jgi:hypothetical protein